MGTKNGRHRVEFYGTARLLFDLNLEKKGGSGCTHDACNTHVGKGGACSVRRRGSRRGGRAGGTARAAAT